jgi:acyl-CoA synthetase (AMP-forming)/AMP-acid ligase II
MTFEGVETVNGAFAGGRALAGPGDAQRPAETAGIYGIPAGEISYGAPGAEVDARAEALRRRAMAPGHRVMLSARKPAGVFPDLAGAESDRGVGGSGQPGSARSPNSTYMIGHAEPALAIAMPGAAPNRRRRPAEAGLRHAGDRRDGCLPRPARERVALRVTTGDGGLEDAGGGAALYLGDHRSAEGMHPHQRLYFLTAGAGMPRRAGFAPCCRGSAERMITPLPVFHMNAMAVSFMAMVAVGGCLTVLDRFHPRTWWQSVRESGATCLHYLGVMPSMLMGRPRGPRPGHRCGSASAPASTQSCMPVSRRASAFRWSRPGR